MAISQNGAAANLDMSAIANPVREFAFADADFRSLSKLAYESAGIVLSDSKRNLVYTRLSRRLRALGMSSFKEYRDYLAGSEGAREVESFINSISTNHTKMFREAHHFAHLRTQVARTFVQDSRGAGGRMRIWSAGCSSGEEPYTIALVLKREIPNIERHDVRILATDIDTDVLAKAARGVYAASTMDEVPEEYRGHFQTVSNSRSSDMMVDEDVRSLIAFRQLNLLKAWPFKGPFDAIFCRNVMIYFDQSTKTSLIDRFTEMLKPGGWLYIGHSESLIGSHPGLQLVGRTIYRREA